MTKKTLLLPSSTVYSVSVEFYFKSGAVLIFPVKIMARNVLSQHFHNVKVIIPIFLLKLFSQKVAIGRDANVPAFHHDISRQSVNRLRKTALNAQRLEKSKTRSVH